MSQKPLLQARKHSERPHVLIVSDDIDLATFLNEGLPLGGFWTTVISSGLQVLEVFRLRQFDLIIIDYSLRSFAADELIMRLRGTSARQNEQAPRTAAPVILISDEPMELSEAVRNSMGIVRTYHAPIELSEMVPDLHAAFDEWRTAYPTLPLSDDPSRRDR